MTRLATLPEGLAGLLAIGLVLLIRTAALRLGLRTAPIPGSHRPMTNESCGTVRVVVNRAAPSTGNACPVN